MSQMQAAPGTPGMLTPMMHPMQQQCLQQQQYLQQQPAATSAASKLERLLEPKHLQPKSKQVGSAGFVVYDGLDDDIVMIALDITHVFLYKQIAPSTQTNYKETNSNTRNLHRGQICKVDEVKEPSLREERS